MGGGVETTLKNRPNLLIKGNNLIALHTLKEYFRHVPQQDKVKLIYIDPPYNTGNDSFNYNDRFNHSTWLTFMKNRLEIARELLRDDGVIFVQCDDNEQAYLKVLMDEIFGRENFLNCVAVKMSVAAGLKMSNKERRMIKIKEYLLVYSKNKNFKFANIDPLYVYKDKYEVERSDKYIENFDDDPLNWYFCSLHEAYNKYMLKNETKLEFVNRNYKRIFNHVVNASTKKNWEKLSDDDKQKYTNKVRYYNVDGSDYDYAYNDHVLIPYNPKILEGDMWCGNFAIGGTKSPEGGVEFSNGKKPEILIQRILEISTNENDLVLDFFVGSGTTLAVAHKMKRRYIGIEQMDYIESITKERLKKVIEGEQGGISKAVSWSGGGNLIYCELASLNAKFIEKIENSSDENELNQIYENLQKLAFIDYRVDIQNDLKDMEFLNLDFIDKKRILKKCLDRNMDYIPYADMDDSEYNIDEQTRILNDIFYKGGNDE